MKKVLGLLAIALIAIGLVVMPQVQAADAPAGVDMKKLEQLEKETEQLEKAIERQGGQPTPQQLERVRQIQQEVMQAAGGFGGYIPQTPNGGATQTPSGGASQYLPPQAQQEWQRQQPAGVIQRMVYPRAKTGWPAASAFRRYGVTVAQPNIQTKDGVTYSYKTEGEKLIIYISKNFSNSVRATEAQVISANGEVDSLGEFNDAQMLAALNHFERAFGAAISSSVGTHGYGGGFKVQDSTKKNTATRVYQIAVNYDFDVIEGTVPIKIDNISGEHKVQYFKFEIEPHSYNPQELQ